MNFNRLHTLFSLRVQLGCRRLTKKIINAHGKDVPKERNTENRITLISPDSSVTITDLKSAQSISQRRDLKLVKVTDVDVKTKRPVFKLMTSAEYHQEELEQRKRRRESRQNAFIKGEKLMNLSAKIAKNDLMTHVKKMCKLLEKRYEVRVVIYGQDDSNKFETIASVIENNTKSVGKLVQKRSKEQSLKFQLVPLKEQSINIESSNSSGDNSTPGGSPKDDRGPL